MDDQREQLIAWLNEAMAMEEKIAKVLEKQLDMTEDFGELQERLKDHLEVTTRHSERLKAQIEKMGGDVSKSKGVIATMMGKMEGIGLDMFKDDVVKVGIVNYATENFEIATYKSLIAAADKLEEPDVADLCEEILDDEVEMAEWLDENIGDLTEKFLSEVS